MRVHVMRTMLLLSLFTTFACDQATDTSDSVAGTYLLASVNERPLPFRPQELSPDDYIEIRESTLTLQADRRFTIVTELTAVVDGDQESRQDVIEGVYSVTPTTVRLDSPLATETAEMTRNNSDLVLRADNHSFLFRRRLN